MEMTTETIDLSKEGLELFASGKAAIFLEPFYVREVCAMLAKQLLAEMDKPKVWDGAPEWTTHAEISYYVPDHAGGKLVTYTREPPKSREREIAEYESHLFCDNKYAIDFQMNLAESIESAILKAKAEWEAGR